ncbi:hypothetical protein LSTR_LSTR013207 [Laodelphax striatellus]|uniref:TGF-beta family profile domain-containing protein n=1 Tax=Laodelphax striatellus TaxID=195883 RepID=A0A482X5I5_LAOST|nr:hypothetical protein LSTR_LSTR013207 [Laodelphax striatellus]
MWLIVQLLLLLSVAAAETDCDAAAAAADQETELRIVQIKEEILRRLKLSEAPVVSEASGAAPPSLPAPLAHLADPPTTSTNPPVHDDVTVDKVILFPVEQGDQTDASSRSALSFRFQLPSQLYAEDLSSAELWLHKEESSDNSEDFLISELSDNGTILFMQKITINSRWANADIGSAVRRWLRAQPKEIFITVYVSCSTCKIGQIPPISQTSDNRPFLVLSINSIEKSRRTKRVVTCEPKTRDCCRQYLNVSFADINWDTWIVEPSYYGAYYCKGSCTTVSSLSESKNSFQMLKRDYNDSQNKTVLPSCCTPHRYGNLQIIYRIGNQLVKATLKDMTVEECKCS